VATKFGMDMGGTNGPDHGARGSRRYVIRAVEASLSRLGTDWIDLY
jgi:aryl-alcohol dehydrogenase-like predicted oxidoreductase